MSSARAQIEQLREAVLAALPVVQYVSSGRGYVDVTPYPDARARRAGALLADALDATARAAVSPDTEGETR